MGVNSNVYAAEPTASGGVFVAPLGTPGPTSAVSTLDVAFIDLGHISDDGVSEKTDRNIEKKRNWGGKVVKVLQTEYSKIYTITFMESLNADVHQAINNPSNIAVVAANSSHGEQIAVKHNTKRPHKLAWVFDSIDSELEAKYRTYVPQGQCISTGDVKRVHTDTIMYEVEIEAFEDADGNHAYDWTDNGSLVIPVPSNWQATHAYTAGEYAKLTAGNKELLCVASGTSGASAPTAPGLGNYVSDGTVVWQQVS